LDVKRLLDIIEERRRKKTLNSHLFMVNLLSEIENKMADYREQRKAGVSTCVSVRDQPP
jgi:hypothetical protein